MPDTFVTRREPVPVSMVPVGPGATLAAVSRSHGLRAPMQAFSFWLQLRGASQVVAQEGSFRLEKGEWIAFDRGSMPEIRTGRDGLALCLMLPPELMYGALDASDRGLLPGRGRLAKSDLRVAVRLWRRCSEQGADAPTGVALRTLRPLLLHLQMAQREFAPLLDRCPGRSFRRKTRIFARIQRARMYLEGNPDRMLRIEELMELTRFSSWWLSKTFHAVYLETLQHASMRVRMERARVLLEHSHSSIGELAVACGFHDPCSFARQFKAWHGETATTWRSQKRAWNSHPQRWTPILAAAVSRASA
ncbi:MAG TPA: AraC family transcriptional regulator [Lysobacter sp.]